MRESVSFVYVSIFQRRPTGQMVPGRDLNEMHIHVWCHKPKSKGGGESLLHRELTLAGNTHTHTLTHWLTQFCWHTICIFICSTEWNVVLEQQFTTEFSLKTHWKLKTWLLHWRYMSLVRIFLLDMFKILTGALSEGQNGKWLFSGSYCTGLGAYTALTHDIRTNRLTIFTFLLVNIVSSVILNIEFDLYFNVGQPQVRICP